MLDVHKFPICPPQWRADDEKVLKGGPRTKSYPMVPPLVLKKVARCPPQGSAHGDLPSPGKINNCAPWFEVKVPP